MTKPQNSPRHQHCAKCRSIILQDLVIVEVSRRTNRGPEMDRALLCASCGELILEHLGRARVETGADTRPVRLRQAAN
jgi:hypothetical protein